MNKMLYVKISKMGFYIQSKSFVVVVFFATLFTTSAIYGQIATWTLQTNGNPTQIGPGITAYPMGLGAGVIDNGFTSHCGGGGCTGRRIRGWTNGTTSIGGAGGAVPNNRYVEFSFSVDAGAEPVTVSNFQFNGSAGFVSNCTGSAGFALRWLIDGVHATPQWLRHPSVCSGELLRNINNANNGTCVTYNTNAASSGACATPFPITVNPGQRIRFRIYIGTTHNSGTNDASHWRALFRDVNITGENPLPVTLTSFNANCESNAVIVNWTTATEQNASHFTLERSRDGLLWDEVKTLSAGGNTSTPQNYNVEDFLSFNSTGYYRLRQVDFDGIEEIFGPISVNCAENDNNLIVYPNPTQNNFTVLIKTDKVIDDGLILIYDLSGKEVIREKINLLSGTNTINFNDNGLASGSYIIRVMTESNDFTPVKLVIQ